MRKIKQKITISVIGIIIVILDQLSKMLMLNTEITIIPNFLNFTYTQNIGIAFGIGNNMLAILIINVIILTSILVFLVLKRKKLDNITYTGLILILAGGMSNMIDRIFNGYVIDFIDVNIFNFPHFNIADISIVVGIIILFITIFKSFDENNI